MGDKLGRWMIKTTRDLPSAEEMRAVSSEARARLEKEESNAALLDICDNIRMRANHGFTDMVITKDDINGLFTPVNRLADLVADKLIDIGYEVDIPGYELRYMVIRWDHEENTNK